MQGDQKGGCHSNWGRCGGSLDRGWLCDGRREDGFGRDWEGDILRTYYGLLLSEDDLQASGSSSPVGGQTVNPLPPTQMELSRSHLNLRFGVQMDWRYGFGSYQHIETSWSRGGREKRKGQEEWFKSRKARTCCTMEASGESVLRPVRCCQQVREQEPRQNSNYGLNSVTWKTQTSKVQ